MRLLIIALFSMLEGCVGVVTLHDSVQHYSAEEVATKHFLVPPTHSITKEEVLSKLGKPERIWQHDNLEYWRYTYGFSWFAVIPYIIIPIPLGIPTGRSGETFTFNGDILVSEDVDRTAATIALCGYLVLGGTDKAVAAGFGCIANSSDGHY